MASRTALKIARVIVQAGSDPRLRTLLPRGAAEANAELLSSCGLLPDWMRALLVRPGFLRLARDLERSVSPGVTLHMVLRKRFIDDHARAALAGGATQCIVLGAGFDSLSLRLSRDHPEVLFVEIEHPATQARRRSGIERMGGGPPNLRLVAADLGLTPLRKALADVRDWSPSAGTVVVAEGLLMYLTGRDVENLLRSVSTVTGVGSRVLFSYLEPDEKGRPQIGRGSWITRVSLRLLGEPFGWAIRREDIGDWLAPLGFDLVCAKGASELRQRYLEPAGLDDLALAEIEGLAVAVRSAT